MQIRTAIRENADMYHIQDPENTILRMQELCGGQLTMSIGAVIQNLISGKQFESAKSICNKFSTNSKDDPMDMGDMKYIKGLRNEIRKAEISDIVMRLINMNGTIEEEIALFEFIEKGLNMGNVELLTISLGKSKDGTKNITLADIWTDEVREQKTRY